MNHQIQEISFDEKATDYENRFNFLLTRSLDGGYERKAKIIKRNTPHSTDSILEVGAGSGLLTHWLVKELEFSKYLGIDISEKMLESAKARFHKNEYAIQFAKGDASDLSTIEDKSFDLITGADIIHHLNDPVKALREWKRVAKKDALLVILESNIFNPIPLLYHIGDESEVRSYLNTDYNLSHWLKEAGWNDIKVVPAPIFTPWKPKMLRPLYSIVDKILVKIPYVNKISAMWVLIAKP